MKAVKYRVTHATVYRSSELVSVGHNESWLIPRSLPFQTLHRHQFDIAPAPSTKNLREDSFGNSVASFSFNFGYEELTVKSISEVTVAARPVPEQSPAWDELRDALKGSLLAPDLDARQFLYESPFIAFSPGLQAYAAESFAPRRPLVNGLRELLERIRNDFAYDSAATTINTPVAEVFENRRGVCQDFAHLMAAGLRSLGIATRYVSGYLRTYPPEGKERLVGADASHAWVSVYCGREIGWLDCDPTNNLFPGNEHVTVAWGRDYGDVPPIRGVYTGGTTLHMHVGVDVEPLHEQFSEPEAVS